MIRRVGTIEALDRGVLSIGRVRPPRRRRAKPEILGAGLHPGLPRAGERRHRVRTRPNSRHPRKRARELLIRSVLLRVSDYRLAHALPQIEPGKNVAWKRDPRHHA